jgi:hypothetical protein
MPEARQWRRRVRAQDKPCLFKRNGIWSLEPCWGEPNHVREALNENARAFIRGLAPYA